MEQQIETQPNVQVEDPFKKEKESLQSKILEERKSREALEAKLQVLEDEKRKAEEEKKKEELSKLPKDERVQQQIRELQDMHQKTVRQLEQERLFFNNQINAINLVAYRERALRDAGPEVIPELVLGSNEQEIDVSLDASRATYKRLQAEFAAKYGRPLPGNDMSGSVPLQNPSIPVVPNEPGAGLPTFANPSGVQGVPSGEMPIDLKSLTSEDAVRSGRYSGELREQLHTMLKNMGAPRNPGWDTPRYLQQQTAPIPQQYIEQPGGVMQPQGSPVAPPINPQMVQKSSVASDMARQAIQRTYNGQNTAISQIRGASEALSDTRAYATRTGANAQGAFATRFANSPPVQQPGQQRS